MDNPTRARHLLNCRVFELSGSCLRDRTGLSNIKYDAAYQGPRFTGEKVYKDVRYRLQSPVQSRTLPPPVSHSPTTLELLYQNALLHRPRRSPHLRCCLRCSPRHRQQLQHRPHSVLQPSSNCEYYLIPHVDIRDLNALCVNDRSPTPPSPASSASSVSPSALSLVSSEVCRSPHMPLCISCSPALSFHS